MSPGQNDKSRLIPSPKRKGNPAFVKGHKLGGRPVGSVNKVTKLIRCVEFMEKKGWKELEYHAMNRNSSKVAVSALNTIAAYGYGRPSEYIDLTSGGDVLPGGAEHVELPALGKAELSMLVKRLAKDTE